MDGYGVKMVLNDQQVLILPGERKQIDVSGFAPSPAKKKAHVSTLPTATMPNPVSNESTATMLNHVSNEVTTRLSMMPLNPAPSMQPIESSSDGAHDVDDGPDSKSSDELNVIPNGNGPISNSPRKRGRPRSKQDSGSNKKGKTRSSRKK